MGSRTAKVPEDVGVVTTGVFQGIGEDREAVRVEGAIGQLSLIVGGLGKSQDGRRLPSGGEGDGAEGVAENVAKEKAADSRFCNPGCK
jgi:hypothetical protein